MQEKVDTSYVPASLLKPLPETENKKSEANEYESVETSWLDDSTSFEADSDAAISEKFASEEAGIEDSSDSMISTDDLSEEEHFSEDSTSSSSQM